MYADEQGDVPNPPNTSDRLDHVAPPPRPDLGDAVLAPEGPPGSLDDAVGADFFQPARRRSRVVGGIAIVVAGLAIASVAASPLISVWQNRHRSHEFRYLATENGSPLRWNPCQPIHYVVNLGAAPPGSLGDVQRAVLEVSGDTGISFVYDGLTDEIPNGERKAFQPARYGDRWAPVLIGWVDPRTNDLGFNRGDRVAAGVASPLFPSRTDRSIFVSGFVAINASDPNPPGFSTPGDQGPVLLHELAHVIGLGHVPEQGELMQPSGGGLTDYGPGDLAGLHALGRSAGCLTTPPVPAS